MIVTRLSAENWRNFRRFDVRLEERMFAVGPNAGGKSNFLDIFRFLGELVRPGGGLFEAMGERGGLPSLRCRSGGKGTGLALSIELGARHGAEPEWRYTIGVVRRRRGDPAPTLACEKVWHRGKQILDRPNADDRRDPRRLEQTYLENLTTNEPFRALADFFGAISYTHLFPQNAHRGGGSRVAQTDESILAFLEEIHATSPRIRTSRMKKIEEALRLAIPNLKNLSFTGIKNGRLRLEAIFQDWRTGGALPQEHFSDGTLRLISILWALLKTDSLVLLEEPEVSLHPAVVRHLPSLIFRLKRHNPGQVILTTHSPELLSDPGIDGREVLLFLADARGSPKVTLAADLKEVQSLIDQGLTIGEIALPRSQPARIEELGFFR